MELSPAAGSSRRRRDLREDDSERRPLAQFRRDVDRAAMGVHDALREREAQSGPLLLRFRREERLEEFLEDVRWHPWAGVVDDQRDRVAAVFDPHGHGPVRRGLEGVLRQIEDRKSTRLNSSHRTISYAVFCLKKKKSWFVGGDGNM